MITTTVWISSVVTLCLYFDVLSVAGKKFDGVLDSSSDWSFVARFCFLSSNGDFHYGISYPLSFYPDGTEIAYELLLYFDDKWDQVYKGSSYRNCSKKRGELNPDLNQIIKLTSRYQDSTCSLLIKTPNGTYSQDVRPWEQLSPDPSVERRWVCYGRRELSTVRDRWWYFVIASCGNPAGLEDVEYHFSFRNDPENPMRKEFSADEFGILETCIAYTFLLTVFVVCSFFVGKELAALNFLHVTFKLYFWSLLLFYASVILLLAAYSHISSTGYEIRAVESAAHVLNAISTIIFVSLLLLLAKGYTVTHGRLAGVVQVVIATIVILLTFLYAVLFFYQIAIFDPAAVLYLYQSPGGYGICAVRMGVWIYFAYACFRTISHHKSKSEFYFTFLVIYTVWFFAFPVFVFLGIAVFEKWVRLKVVTIIEMTITFLAHAIILALMWPTHNNRFFPFHVRVAQIGAISDPDDSDDEQANGNRRESDSVNFGVGPRIPGAGYRAPSNWNIFTGTGGYDNNSIMMTESSGRLPPLRANTYNLFTAGSEQTQNNTDGIQPQAEAVTSPRFSEIYGSDKV